MAWTQAHQTLLDQYAAKFGLPALDGGSARAWTYKLAQQFRWSFSGSNDPLWGTKQADSGRPQSTDCICTKVPFLGYDVIISQGTPQQYLASFPEALNLTGQIFIVVEPFNHLGEAPPTPTPIPPPTSFPYPNEPTTIKAYQDRVKATYNEAGRQFPDPNDSDAFRWFTRYAYDCSRMPEPDSANAHIKELRTELGLKP
jgi:hypothetical protein